MNNSFRKELFPEEGSRSTLVVLVSESTVENENVSDYKKREAAFEKRYQRKDDLAFDDYFIFKNKRLEILNNGSLSVNATRIEFDLIEVMAYIHDRGCGDEDGFGVEPDTIVKGYLDLDGNFVSPIALLASRTNVNINNWLKLGTNPLDASGKVKLFPYDDAEWVLNKPELFVLTKGTNVGLADKKLNILIPLSYKMLYVDDNGLVWVRLHTNLCGLVDTFNNIQIPPVYDYLSIIDDGKNKGLYVAELNGKHGVINKNNQVVVPFKEMNVASIYKKIEKRTLQNNCSITTTTSKSIRRFWLIDLLLSSLWALFVFRIWTGNVMTALCVDNTLINWWAAPIVFYVVMLRLSVSVMMFRNDKQGLWASLLLIPASVASVLLSRFDLMDAIPDVFNFINLAGGGFLNPAMRWFGHLLGFESYNDVIHSTWGVFLFCWIWFLPFLYFYIRRKKCISTGLSLTAALSGIYLFQNLAGKKYLKICVFALIAFTIGRVMNSYVSLVGLAVLSFAFYRLISQKKKHTFSAYEWIGPLLAVIAVWLAQYQTGTVRIGLLAVCLFLTFWLATKIEKGKIKLFKWILLTVVAGVLLPSVCLGYNVFNLTDVKRLELLDAKYNLTGVMKVQDSQGNIGLRDRYRMIIPAQYSDIQDYELPYLKVKKGLLWGVWNTQYAGFVKGNYDNVIIGGNSDNKNYEDLCFQVKPENAFIEPMENNVSRFRYKRVLNDTLSTGELFSE